MTIPSHRHGLALIGEIFSTVHKDMESIKQDGIESPSLLEQSLIEHCKYQTFLLPSRRTCFMSEIRSIAWHSILWE